MGMSRYTGPDWHPGFFYLGDYAETAHMMGVSSPIMHFTPLKKPASSSFVRNPIASIWWTICEDDPLCSFDEANTAHQNLATFWRQKTGREDG
jgi:hypothetical protein